MKIAIIGCGLIGKKRANAIDIDDKLVACCDVNEIVGEKFATEYKCKFYKDYKKILFDNKIDVAIIAVINKYIREIAEFFISKGINVIVEKPLGRNANEAEELLNIDSNIILKVGFNHRFHPAIWNAKKNCDSGRIGKIFSIRARYGHGGRPGMEKEWRANKELCGGGELLDQGVHIIDLVRWFGGEIIEVYGKTETKFWNVEVEDNAYCILKTSNKVTAIFNVSMTNWKNIFSFEVFGTDGYIRIEGLGGSYGVETLEIGIRKKEGGIPGIEKFEYPPEDVSLKNELIEFKSSVLKNRDVLGNGLDGLRANQVIEAIYESSKIDKTVYLNIK